MKTPKLSQGLSKVPLHITLKFNKQALAVGTGFIYRNDQLSYLITNWHNLSGRSNITGEPLHSARGVPNEIVIRLPKANEYPDGRLGIEWKPITFPLYDEDIEKPNWYEHPNFGCKVDVVALPISFSDDFWIFPLNEIQNEFDLNIPLEPGMDVFILGFPKGMSGGGRFPIWKRGSIATEPDFDQDNLPKLLIDSATREGMSGSPVIAQYTGVWNQKKSDGSGEEKVVGSGRRFLGIYSGRLGGDEFEAQLGIVWKASVVEEIIEGQKTGTNNIS